MTMRMLCTSQGNAGWRTQHGSLAAAPSMQDTAAALDFDSRRVMEVPVEASQAAQVHRARCVLCVRLPPFLHAINETYRSNPCVPDGLHRSRAGRSGTRCLAMLQAFQHHSPPPLKLLPPHQGAWGWRRRPGSRCACASPPARWTRRRRSRAACPPRAAGTPSSARCRSPCGARRHGLCRPGTCIDQSLYADLH